MTKFQTAQLVSVAMSLALVAASWLATIAVPAAPLQLAAGSTSVELA